MMAIEQRACSTLALRRDGPGLRGAGEHFCAGAELRDKATLRLDLPTRADALADTSAVFRLPETLLGRVPAQTAPFQAARSGYAEAAHGTERGEGGEGGMAFLSRRMASWVPQ